jgi:phosphoribosylformimino-5-aminoimidazole carboxamide ribotide isomerase
MDLHGGHCVRLRQGRFDESTVYSGDPVAVARAFESAGAQALHVVDLDGARQRRPAQLELVRAIAGGVKIPLQLGGGLRSTEDVDAALDAGVTRVLLGSALALDPGLGGRLAERFGARVGAAVDALLGRVRVNGWQAGLELRASELIARLREQGITWFLCTDIERDGMLEGPALAWYKELRQAHPDVELLASGGIASEADLGALRAAGIDGAVLGKALYEGRIALADALRAAGS